MIARELPVNLGLQSVSFQLHEATTPAKVCIESIRRFKALPGDDTDFRHRHIQPAAVPDGQHMPLDSDKKAFPDCNLMNFFRLCRDPVSVRCSSLAWTYHFQIHAQIPHSSLREFMRKQKSLRMGTCTEDAGYGRKKPGKTMKTKAVTGRRGW